MVQQPQPQYQQTVYQQPQPQPQYQQTVIQQQPQPQFHQTIVQQPQPQFQTVIQQPVMMQPMFQVIFIRY